MTRATYATTYSQRVPYVTIAEVKASPTASTLDLTDLIPNGTQTQQDAALQDLIIRASAKADNYVYGALGTITATVESENGRTFINRSGQFIIHPAYWPILEVQSFSFGSMPGSGMMNVPLSDDNCFIERHQFIVTTGPLNQSSIGPLTMFGAYSSNTNQFMNYTYVNGFANTFLTANVATNASAIPVGYSTGIYPGEYLTLWDGALTETVQVASTYNGSDLSIPLVSPTAHSHSKGVNFSAIPPTVKQAVIHFVVAMVKQRGQGGMVLNEIGEPTAISGSTVTSIEDDIQGYDLLDDFRQVWGRA